MKLHSHFMKSEYEYAADFLPLNTLKRWSLS